MPLSSSSSQRRLMHRRSLDVQVYARADGLFDVDAMLRDIKTQDIPLELGTRRAGDPLHEMSLHLVVDAKLDVIEASSSTAWMPYPGSCDQHGDAYRQLAGMNLLKGFRHGVKERLSGVKACTHLTELCQILPTAVIQALAGTVIGTRDNGSQEHAPFQIDKCHALRSDGPVVQTHYPRWYRGGLAQAEPQALPASSS